MSISDFGENELLKFLKEKGALWVQLHIGNPGEAGTSNLAAETTRKKIEFAEPSAGAMASSIEQLWPSLAATENVSHISIWSASSAGNHWWYGALEEVKNLVKEEQFAFKVGEVILTLD